MKTKCFLLIGVVFIMLSYCSCNNFNVKEHFRHEYLNNLKFYNSTFISHFPKDYPDNSIFLTNIFPSEFAYKKSSGFVNYYTYLVKKYSEIEFLRLKKQLVKYSETIYEADENKLLLIFSYSNDLEIHGKKYSDWESPKLQKLAKHNLLATSLPVPLFESDEYKGNTFSGLPEDFKIYVLDAKQGKYLEDKYLYDCSCLPEKWKHGYSKGVALSDKRKVIIYWVTVW